MTRDPISLDTAERMLSYVRGVDDRETWVKIAYVLQEEFGEPAFDMWDQWSQGSQSYDVRAARSVWKSCGKPSGKGRAGIGTLVALAKEGGWTPTQQDRKQYTPEELAERQADRQRRQQEAAERAERERAEAAQQAAELWARAKPCGPHPYLRRKQISGIGARELDGAVLVPMRHGPGALVGLQRIFQDGEKKFLTGTPSVGAYTTIGKPSRTGPVVIAEGYATAESVHFATGWCVVVAFHAGNLEPVSRKIRAAMPEAEIILAADDDAATQQRTGTNPGMKAATEAALAVGGTIARPLWAGDRGNGTDFNDLHVSEGLDAVRMCFEDPKPPESFREPDNEPEPAVPSDDESFGPDDTVPEFVPPRASVVSTGERPLIFTSMPMKTAELFHSTLPEGGRIIFWRGEFYSWDGCRYVVRDMVYMEQRLYFWMAGCDTWKVDTKTGDTEVVAFNPKPVNVRDVCHALRAVCYTAVPDAGHWLDEQPGDFPGAEIIAFRNCFLHWPTGTILPSTDRLLVTSALEFDYNPHADKPTSWMGFLAGVWPNDQQAIDTLAEMFGYLLTDDTSQQKIFMLIGPPRSGKGTILRILEALVGRSNRCSPTLSSLGGPFGLQSLLGKRMAMISDARLSGRADQQPIVENLLRISGEDAVDVNRKNLPSLDGVMLRARFVMATNELPAFSDASSALANRFIPFKFTRSFLGSEDHGLTDRLLHDLPGILLWALEGLNRLRGRGYFVVPESAREVSSDLLDQTSPIRSFVTEMCLVGDQYQCDRDDLYKAWKAWCEEQGRDHPGTKVTFGRQIHAAFPAIKRTQPRVSGTGSSGATGTGTGRLSLYSGIRIRHDWEQSDDPY